MIASAKIIILHKLIKKYLVLYKKKDIIICIIMCQIIISYIKM